MRTLTKRQKTLLDKWVSEYAPATADELKPEHWHLLKALNNTEILYQEVDRYLWDSSWSVDSIAKKLNNREE